MRQADGTLSDKPRKRKRTILVFLVKAGACKVGARKALEMLGIPDRATLEEALAIWDDPSTWITPEMYGEPHEGVFGEYWVDKVRCGLTTQHAF